MDLHIIPSAFLDHPFFISISQAISSQLQFPQDLSYLILSLNQSVKMARFALLVVALVAPFAFAVPTPGNSYGTGGSAPAGYNASVENFCTVPDALYCCTQVVGGIAGEPDATATGCKSALFSELLFRQTSANHPGSNRH